MRKKGVQISLITLIILIICFILILVLQSRISTYLKKSNSREFCRLSVSSMQATLIEAKIGGPGGKETIFHLDCPMQYVDIKNSDLPKDEGKTDNFISKKIADSMYDCWYQMGKGEYSDFEDKIGDKTSCLLCSRISFEKKDIEIADFDKWLTKNAPAGSSFSYDNFLTLNGKKRYCIIDDNSRIESGISYYTFFVANNDGANLNDIFKKNMPVEERTLSSAPFSAVCLVKESDFKNLGCEELLN